MKVGHALYVDSDDEQRESRDAQEVLCGAVYPLGRRDGNSAVFRFIATKTIILL